jgi:predicted SpoU family rRNA methylase
VYEVKTKKHEFLWYVDNSKIMQPKGSATHNITTSTFSHSEVNKLAKFYNELEFFDSLSQNIRNANIQRFNFT